MSPLEEGEANLRFGYCCSICLQSVAAWAGERFACPPLSGSLKPISHWEFPVAGVVMSAAPQIIGTFSTPMQFGGVGVQANSQNAFIAVTPEHPPSGKSTTWVKGTPFFGGGGGAIEIIGKYTLKRFREAADGAEGLADGTEGTGCARVIVLPIGNMKSIVRATIIHLASECNCMNFGG